jgi:hypothetical protein
MRTSWPPPSPVLPSSSMTGFWSFILTLWGCASAVVADPPGGNWMAPALFPFFLA